MKENCDGSPETVRVEGTERDDRSRWLIHDRWDDEEWRAVPPFTPNPE